MKDKDIVDKIVDGEMDKYLQKLKDKSPMWDQKVKIGKKLMQPNDESNSGASACYAEPAFKGDLLAGILDEIINTFGKECPNSNNCGNDGTLAEHGCNGTEEDCMKTCPIPAPCEFCYTEPQSKFNLKQKLNEFLEASKQTA